MATGTIQLKSGVKLTFYATATRTAEGQGTVTWRASTSGSSNGLYSIQTLTIGDKAWCRADGSNDNPDGLDLRPWCESLSFDITPNSGDYYRGSYTIYVQEKHNTTNSVYNKSDSVNITIKLNNNSSSSGESTDSGGSSSSDTDTGTIVTGNLSSGAVGQIYISYSVTKTSMGQGTITWKYKTAYGQMSSAYSGITVTKDGSDIGLQPSTSYVTFATENISAGEDGRFSQTYTFTLSETNVNTGRTTVESTRKTVSAQLTDQSEPSVDVSQGYISRTGSAYIQAYYTHSANYTSKVTLTLYLNDGKSKTVTASGSASGFITLSEDVASLSTENTYYSYTITAECQNGKTRTVYGTVYRTSRVYTIDAPNAVTLTTVNNSRWISAKAYGINRGSCEISTFSYASSDTSIATVDENGIVAKVANGTCSITVTSRDSEALCEPITVSILCIDSRDFPDDLPTGGIDMLPAELMSDIIDAVISLSDDKGIQITADVSTFNSYSTQIKDVYSVLNNTNTNIKTLCTGTSTANTLPATFPLQNKNAEWHSIVNQWLSVIHLMHNGG